MKTTSATLNQISPLGGDKGGLPLTPTQAPISKRSLALIPALLLVLAASLLNCALAQSNPNVIMAFERGTSGIHNTGGTTHILSFNVSGSDTLLVVGWAHDDNGHVTSVTYNGVSMSSIADQSVARTTGGQALRTGMFYLLNPAAGTHDLALTRNISSATMDFTVALYTGVKQSGQPDTSTSRRFGRSSANV